MSHLGKWDCKGHWEEEEQKRELEENEREGKRWRKDEIWWKEWDKYVFMTEDSQRNKYLLLSGENNSILVSSTNLGISGRP